MPLTNQLILVTGAAGGLGGCASRFLANQGATILLLDKNLPKLERIYDCIVTENGAEPIICPFDLAGANEQQYLELAESIMDRFGSLQGVLHSAVEFSAYTPISQHSTHDWGHTLNVNLNSVFLLCRVLLPVLQNSSHASIVFTSDSTARVGPAYAGAYGVSKIALEGFARILAEELEAGQKNSCQHLGARSSGYPYQEESFSG